MRGEVQRRDGVTVLVWPDLADLGVDAAVSTREGGVSEGPYRSLNLGLHVGDDSASVIENRRRAAAALGATLESLVVGRQVHGTTATVVTGAESGRGARDPEDALGATDALVTRTAGPVLVTLVADCSPVLLVDPQAGVLAAVHAGWRGALAPGGGAVGAAVRAMARLGAIPARTVTVIGPTVSSGRYEVGEEVVEAARSSFGGDAASVVLEGGGGGRLHFDVAGANRLQLLAAGVPAANVHREIRTTDDPLFFSDRAERPCGRFALLARLRDA